MTQRTWFRRHVAQLQAALGALHGQRRSCSGAQRDQVASTQGCASWRQIDRHGKAALGRPSTSVSMQHAPAEPPEGHSACEEADPPHCCDGHVGEGPQPPA